MKLIHNIAMKWNLDKFFIKLFSLNKTDSKIDLNKKYFNLISDSLLDFIEKNSKQFTDTFKTKYKLKIM